MKLAYLMKNNIYKGKSPFSKQFFYLICLPKGMQIKKGAPFIISSKS